MADGSNMNDALASSLNRLYNLNMGQSQVLYRLQQIDSQLDQANGRILEIERTLESNSELEQSKVNLSEAQNQLVSAQSSLRDAEQLVQDQCIKIAQSEAALYGGKIRIPKELQDLQNEVVSLKKYLIVLEDRQLEQMEAVEAAQDRLDNAQSIVDQLEASWSEQTAHLKNEASKARIVINRLEAERNAALNPITPELLQIYEGLRRQRNGIAVAILSGKSCSACGTTLTPAVVQSVQVSPTFIRCPTCNRILYSG